MSSDEEENQKLNAKQLLMLADAFEKLAQCYAEEAKEKSLKNPFAIAEDMIQKAITANDAEGYKAAILLFDRIKKSFESALLSER